MWYIKEDPSTNDQPEGIAWLNIDNLMLSDRDTTEPQAAVVLHTARRTIKLKLQGQ